MCYTIGPAIFKMNNQQNSPFFLTGCIYWNTNGFLHATFTHRKFFFLFFTQEIKSLSCSEPLVGVLSPPVQKFPVPSHVSVMAQAHLKRGAQC